jgi:hypothetical protein
LPIAGSAGSGSSACAPVPAASYGFFSVPPETETKDGQKPFTQE